MHPYGNGGAVAGPYELPTAPTRVLCINCRYDLAGTAIGQVCPECGTPVATTLTAYSTGLSSGKATACMIVGICSLAACGLAGPVAIVLYRQAKLQMADGGYAPSSQTMALTGLILGIIATGITVLSGIVVVIALLVGP